MADCMIPAPASVSDGWWFRLRRRLPIWNNVITAPNRWMAFVLRRRGWVCFYLDERARFCPSADMRDRVRALPRYGINIGKGLDGNCVKVEDVVRLHDSHGCWLKLYQDSEG